MIFLAVRRKIVATPHEARLGIRALQSAISDILPERHCDGLIPPCAQKTICCFCLGSPHSRQSHCLPPAVVAVLQYPLLTRRRQCKATLLPHPPVSNSVARRRQALPSAPPTNSSPRYRPAAP